jgi:predicted RNA-binding Zn-ribbon protein involved in translation (DUF1610 family)
MSSRFEGAADFRRLLQETHRQRSTALIGTSSLREALRLPDEALSLLIADSVSTGELVPEDVIRCANCRREAEPGVSLQHFVCPDCDGEEPLVYRVYSITDEVFNNRSIPQKKTRGSHNRRLGLLAKMPFLRRFFATHSMMTTT